MPGIDHLVIVHRLNVSPSFPPICQKKRVFTPKRDRAIAKEVCKLLEMDFIKEVYYLDWLANVMMANVMGVDFIDLNKACLKDSYPLLQVDVLVDSMAQH